MSVSAERAPSPDEDFVFVDDFDWPVTPSDLTGTNIAAELLTVPRPLPTVPAPGKDATEAQKTLVGAAPPAAPDLNDEAEGDDVGQIEGAPASPPPRAATHADGMSLPRPSPTGKGSLTPGLLLLVFGLGMLRLVIEGIALASAPASSVAPRPAAFRGTRVDFAFNNWSLVVPGGVSPTSAIATVVASRSILRPPHTSTMTGTVVTSHRHPDPVTTPSSAPSARGRATLACDLGTPTMPSYPHQEPSPSSRSLAPPVAEAAAAAATAAAAAVVAAAAAAEPQRRRPSCRHRRRAPRAPRPPPPRRSAGSAAPSRSRPSKRRSASTARRSRATYAIGSSSG